MKTKLILSSFALAASFVGCNNEDFITESNMAEEQSGMIELSDNFMISGVGINDAATRTHWELVGKKLTNVYSPLMAAAGEGNNWIYANNGSTQTPVIAPSIGLCWIGTGNAGEQVYTNYEFYHNGWLGKGQDKAVFDPCDESVLTNGWLYSDLKLPSPAPSLGKEAVTVTYSGSTPTANVAEMDAGSKKDANDNTTILNLDEINLNSGVYKTDNKAIFGGNYIAYFPYNGNFKDAGAIPATSKVEFTEMKNNDPTDFQLSDNTFRYSDVVGVEGGQKASKFGFTNLSGVVRIVLKSKNNTTQTTQVSKVMLYSPSSAFVKEVLLSPAKIAAKATGTDLYSQIVETNKTIVVSMSSGSELSITKNNATDFSASTVYLTALPAKMSDLVVMVQSTDGKWAEYTVGNFEIPAGAGKELVVNFADSDFKEVYYAVDQTTLTAAITKCIGASLTANKTATIKVLGDIVLSTATEIPSYVTVEGDKVIVPEDITLTLTNNSAIKSEVLVEGKSCCSTATAGGKLSVGGATIYGKVTTTVGEATPAKAASIEFTAAGAKVANTAVINAVGVVDFKNNSNVSIYGTLTVDDIATVAENSIVAVKGGTINNNGTFEVLGDFSMLDSTGSTVASAGENFKNNGDFIDNVGSKVGGATQYMVFGENGDYICKVDGINRMNVAYENRTACSTIDIIGSDKNGGAFVPYTFEKIRQHKGKDVNIIVSHNGVRFEPTKEITIGNLTVNQGLRINQTAEIKGANGSHVGWATITVNGDITASALIVLSEDVRSMKANNLTVLKGGHAQFNNRVKSQDKTLEVSKTIDVQKDGQFTIDAAASGKNIAYVTCTKLIEGGIFSGKPDVVE